MKKVCIFGIGSPSGDDQAGWLAVDALLDAGIHAKTGLVIEKLDRPGANLIPLMENADWVILIDAMQNGGEAGRILRFGQQDWPGYRQGCSSHGFGVLDALTLARELGSLPPRLDLYGIEVDHMLPGTAPGASVQAAARALARRISTELDASLLA
ncbi:MAG: hydrogenase maturation protease [Thiobacillus sp.]